MTSLASTPTGMRWKGCARHLLVAEVVSVILFASFGSLLAGLMAPIWGLAIPFLTLWDWRAGAMQGSNLRFFLVLSALVLVSLVPVVVSMAGRWPKWVGHGGLLVYNAASVAAMLALV